MNCSVLLTLGVRNRWQKMRTATMFLPLIRRRCNGVRFYPPSQWEEAMNRVLRALSVSEKGIQQLSKSDKACCVMEWNDQRESSYREFERFCLRRTFDRPCGRGGRFSLNLQKTNFSKCQIEKN